MSAKKEVGLLLNIDQPNIVLHRTPKTSKDDYH